MVYNGSGNINVLHLIIYNRDDKRKSINGIVISYFYDADILQFFYLYLNIVCEVKVFELHNRACKLNANILKQINEYESCLRY